ncbi:hypothetical protein ACWDGI_19965 [Streptomyces sp. NPDC001220]
MPDTVVPVAAPALVAAKTEPSLVVPDTPALVAAKAKPSLVVVRPPVP